MAKMTTCILSGRLTNIDSAIDLKDSAPAIQQDFRCTECNQPVRPHRAGGHAAAHFEHLERNPDCSNSHFAR
jgi:hypothetical protein